VTMTSQEAHRAVRIGMAVIAFVVVTARVANLQIRVERLEHPTPAVRVTSTPAPQATPRHSPGVASRSRPLLALGHDWQLLAQCESAGNPRAVSRTGRYRGLVQFSLASWHATGMTGDPIDYPPDVQLAAAERLLHLQGRRAWPVCGRWIR
jgi:hypothetical protein